MNRLAQEIGVWVCSHVRTQVANLEGPTGEYRGVFNGPPTDVLLQVFEQITVDGGILAKNSGGETIVVPVVIKISDALSGQQNPPIGSSGKCDDHHLLALRNSPHSPVYVALLPPGNQTNLSQTSTRSEFGLSAHNNSAAAEISDWWADPFIQMLARGALNRYQWKGNEDARDALRLVETSIRSADEVIKHDVARTGPWHVLQRLWSISTESAPFGSMVSLACGYPPLKDGGVDPNAQIAIFESLVSRFEDVGISPTFEVLKTKSESKQVNEALDDLLHNLLKRCDVPTAVARSMPYYYGPFPKASLGPLPLWWRDLTVEVWSDLLEEDEKPKGSIAIDCLNSVASQVKGVVPVVQSEVLLEISIPEEAEATDILVVRESGGEKNKREWRLTVTGTAQITDDQPPVHKSPLRYTVEAVKQAEKSLKLKKSAIRVVSLDSWGPGFFICSRTATKATPPKAAKSTKDKVAFEQSLTLSGHGRHYLDVYTNGSTTLAPVAYSSNESGGVDQERPTSIASVGELEHGFEVESGGEGFYQFEVFRDAGKGEHVRVYLSADETSAEECSSEFERLIRLNKQRDGARATTDVAVDYQARCSVLQSWMLARERVHHSYYPVVLGPDYAVEWRPRDWRSAKDTVFSQGKYLHDPRPRPDEMEAPSQFIEARVALASRIRGEENGLVEAARLGEWTAADSGFAELVERYVRGYSDWLDTAGDVAIWSDLALVTRFEMDGTTLVQEPDAIIVSPLHPVRLAWHCLAQRALFMSHRKRPCPAGSILDPDCVPDSLHLPLRTAGGGIKPVPFFSLECSSDYWGVLWNAAKLDRLPSQSSNAPFDDEFGILLGGLSSGFSVSQVHRALNDIYKMLVAKPVMNVLISSVSAQNNACNEGLISWCREHLDQDSSADSASVGRRLVQVLDERPPLSRPEDAEISNLAEDTGNSVRWFTKDDRACQPDLGIIAQLESSNPAAEPSKLLSPLSFGGLVRSRIRQQLNAGEGALLSETRMGEAPAASGDGLADKTATALARMENIGERLGYVFAPSVPTVQAILKRAEYAAVSSSAVDPACFLGGWLSDSYLWDYDLPSYSSRSGDSNGYYLLSQIKALDRESLTDVLKKLPGCADISPESTDEVILEVSRRGIPTVRSLSSGNTGATGSLGLLIATRLLQDEFRTHSSQSILPIWQERDGQANIALVVPVDPFTGHFEELARALKQPSVQRPDLLVVGISITDSAIRCHLTPIEVKYRGSKDTMSAAACKSALEQASCLSALFKQLMTESDEPEQVMWKVAFQHLLSSMLGYGFRVYSQQLVSSNKAPQWSECHARTVRAIFSGEARITIDGVGRLIVIAGSMQGASRDFDGDDFNETIVLGHPEAASIVKGGAEEVYDSVRKRVGTWKLLPHSADDARQSALAPDPAPARETPTIEQAEPQPPSRPQPSPSTPSDGEAPEIPPARLPSPILDQANTPPMAPPNDEPPSGLKVRIGSAIDGFEQGERTLHLGNTELNQINIGVAGDLGTGKTQLIKSLLLQISRGAKQNRGVQPNVLIFDYKKDYSSPEFVKAVGARVLVPHHLPVNLFDIGGAGTTLTPWLDRFKFFADVLDKIYSGVGAVQRGHLKAAVRKAYDRAQTEHRQPNIYDVHGLYEEAISGKMDSVFSILDDLVDMELFAPGAGTFADLMKGVVVVSLDALGQDDSSKNMLVAIMLNLFYENMLRIEKRPFFGPSEGLRVVDSYLLVDEADNIMKYEFDVLKRILLQGREFGVGVILASQYLRHFKAGATDYRDPLVSWLIHKVPNVTAHELSALGMTGELSTVAERIKGLEKHECLFKSVGHADFVRGLPFYKLFGDPLPNQ